jgi:hypothetical protein
MEKKIKFLLMLISKKKNMKKKKLADQLCVHDKVIVEYNINSFMQLAKCIFTKNKKLKFTVL